MADVQAESAVRSLEDAELAGELVIQQYSSGRLSRMTLVGVAPLTAPWARRRLWKWTNLDDLNPRCGP